MVVFPSSRNLLPAILCLLLVTSSLGSHSEQEAAVDWIRSNAIPLKTVDPGSGFDDLQPLAKVVGDARIVALGEATHGTHEFFRLKHRIIEFLAAQKGFTIFAIEANMPEAYRVNQFVLNGEGDPKQLLKGMYFWTWDTEEVLDMILWMREFNRSGRRRIEFTGFDMQNPKVAMQIVQAFIAAHDERYLSTLIPIYLEVRHKAGKTPSASREINQTIPDHLLALQCRDIVEHLGKNRDTFARSGASLESIDWAIQNATIVLQYMLLRSGEQTRDQSMAANVEWIAQHNPEAKIVLWADNGHVKYTNAPGFDPMGRYLHKTFGRELVNFGFAFNQGSFRAYEPCKGLHEITVHPLGRDSLDSTLAAAGIPFFALDLRTLPQNGPVNHWLGGIRPMRNVGAVYSEDKADTPMVIGRERWPEGFDVILFVESTTPSRANPESTDNGRQ